jgi:hypothetical protein
LIIPDQTDNNGNYNNELINNKEEQEKVKKIYIPLENIKDIKNKNY